jgi:NAD(P)-dependent dehydrogenase (short-subunit alcohol dehydrogenase family)
MTEAEASLVIDRDRRHVLVTGAGGLGRVLTVLLIRAGAQVTVVDCNADALSALPESPSLNRMEADLSGDRCPRIPSGQRGRLFRSAARFVATAAVIRRQYDPKAITEADWDFQVTVN